MTCPFSLRPPPKTLTDFTFDNDFAIVPLKLRLVNSVTNGIKALHQDMVAMKKSLDPIGWCYSIKLAMFLPTFLRDFILEDFCDRMTFGFSNVPGPKSRWITAGKRCQGIGFIMPVGKSIVGSFSILSHADVVKMIISMDKETMEDPAVIAEYLKKNLDEILADPNWRNYGTERGIK